MLWLREFYCILNAAALQVERRMAGSIVDGFWVHIWLMQGKLLVESTMVRSLRSFNYRELRGGTILTHDHRPEVLIYCTILLKVIEFLELLY